MVSKIKKNAYFFEFWIARESEKVVFLVFFSVWFKKKKSFWIFSQDSPFRKGFLISKERKMEKRIW